MSFNEKEYLKLRQQRLEKADGTTPSASADTAGQSTFEREYLKLREQRLAQQSSGSTQTTAHKKVTVPELNLDFSGAANSRDIVKQLNQNSLLTRLGQNRTGEVTGGSQFTEVLNSGAEEKHSAVKALEPLYGEKKSALETAQGSMETAKQNLEKWGNHVAFIKNSYDQNPTAEKEDLFNRAYAEYERLRGLYDTEYETYSAAYDDFKPVADEYEAASTEYQKYMQDLPGLIRDLQPAKLHTEETAKGKELQAAYEENQQKAADDAALMEQDIAIYETWPDEDKNLLQLYILNRPGSESSLSRILSMLLNGIDTPIPKTTSGIQPFQELSEKYGAQTVLKLAESVNRYQNAQRAQNAKQAGQEGAQTAAGKIGHSLLSVGANTVGTLTSPINVLSNLVTHTGRYSSMDPNGVGQMAGQYAASVRQNVADAMEADGSAWGKAGATLYDAGMSALDSMSRGLVSGGESYLAGLGSFGQSVRQWSEKGASPVQALAMGTIDGALEMLTEKYSLENLFDMAKVAPKSLTELLKRAAAQGGIEVSEEMANFIGSTLAEAAIMQEDSTFNQTIAKRTAAGESYEEAKYHASMDLVTEAAETIVQSFLSGGMMTGVTQAGSAVQNKYISKKYDFAGMSAEDVNEYVSEALQLDPESEAYKVAYELRQKEKTGQKISAYDIGRLYQANLIEEQKAAEQVDEDTQLPNDNGSEQVNSQAVEKTARSSGFDSASAERISQAIGREIVVYTSPVTETGVENGYHLNGKIYVNTNGVEPMAQVIGHELTHNIENADTYQELSALVLNRIQQQGGNLQNMRAEKKALYERNGISISDGSAIDKEIVADYLSKNLLDNEQNILELTQQNRTLAERIKQWLDNLLAKLGSVSAQERAFVRKARDLYGRALQNTTNVVTDTSNVSRDESKNAAHQEIADIRDFANAAYAEGSMTEEEYSSIMEFADQQEDLLRGDTEQFSYSGVEATNADLDALERAKELDAQDVSAETIRQQTGWFKGIDGKWRWEIDDSQMKYFRGGDALFTQDHPEYARHQELTQEMLTGDISQEDATELQQLNEIWGREYGRLSARVNSGAARLENMIQHDKLFQAYPKLRDTRVIFSNIGGKRGSFDNEHNIITIDSSLRNAPEKTLLHEIQHAIQDIEGFASGSSIEYWNEQLAGGANVQTAGLQEAADKLWEFVNRPQNAAVMEYVQRLEQAALQDDNFAAYDAIMEEASDIGFADLIDEYYSLRDEYYWQKGTAEQMDAKELYRNTAGEIEARDTARRRNMDEEGRKKTPPDLGSEKMVHTEKRNNETFDIAKTIDNKPFVIVTENILDGVKETDWIATVKKNLKNKFPEGITVGKRSILIDRQSRKEMTFSKYMQYLYKNDKALWEQKLMSTNNADEIMLATTDWVNEGLKHSRKDDIVDFARGKVLLRIGKADYSADVVVGTRKNGEMLLYDIVGLTPTIITQKATDTAYNDNPSKENARQAVPVTDYSLPQSNDAVNENFDEQYGLRLRSVDDEDGKQYSISPVSSEDNKQDNTSGEDIRTTLPVKAQAYLRRVEGSLLNKVGQSLSVPKYARREFLRDIVREISDTYLRTGTVDQETTDRLFEMAYSQGVVEDATFYEENKEVKDYLRSQRVTISDRDKNDIPDFNLFRKSTMGYLKIVNEGGLAVDTAYMELQDMAPHLFPESITHPADQLQHMFDVSRSIAVVKRSLDQAYGDNKNEYRKFARYEFESAINDIAGELRNVKRFADERAEKAKTEVPTTAEEAKEIYAKLKDARRAYERVAAKNLLTESDEMKVGRLLRGEILPEHLDPETDNVAGITAVFEAKAEYERLCKLIGQYKKSLKAALREEADKYLDTANDWKDKKTGLAYSRETMRRNVYDIIPDKTLAEKVNETYFEPVHDGEAAAVRFKTEYRDKIREMKLSRKPAKGDLVSEAHAVQLLGEAMDNINILEKARGMLKHRDGKTLGEWRAVIQEMWDNSPSLDRRKIEAAVSQFRKIYDELFEQMNDVRVRNGYEPVNYRKGYFPHFQPGDGDGILKLFGKAMGIDTQVNVLPTTINGLTHTFKPGIQWFGNAQERLGFNTAYDAVEGFDKYIEGVASVIHQTHNIQKLRALATQIRYRTSDEGIRAQVDAVNANPNFTEEQKQVQIANIYEHGKYTLSNFVNELDEYTNLLANKKSRLDRTVESQFGRRVYTFLKNWENRVGANMIAGNLTSAFTNWIPLTQAGAQVDKTSLLRGMWDTLKAYKADDGIAAQSSFLTNRRGSTPLIRAWTEKVSSYLGKPMELIDNFTADSIVRAAYYQNLKRGLSENEAMHQADIFASGVMADRSKGAMPTLFESTNPLFKAFTQFQLEVNNQFSEVFKDLPRNHRKKGLLSFAAVLLQYFLGAFLYNEVYEYFVGRRPALDPFGIINDTVGDLTGYELPNLVDAGIDLFNGEDINFETEQVGIGEAGANLAGSVVEELPFSSGLTLLGIETDGGRLPVASAVPDLIAILEAATTEGWSDEKRWKEIQDELNKLAYVAPPFGGNQISKVWKGVKAYIEGGSHSVDKDGNDILQYPVFKDGDAGDYGALAQMMILGKSSLKEAREWVESDFDSMSAKQTALYKDLLDAGIDDRDAYAVIRSLEGLENDDEKRSVLRRSSISGEGKAVIYYSSIASEKERDLMDKLDDAGAAPTQTFDWMLQLKEIAPLKGVEKKEAQYEAVSASDLTEDEKTVIVGSFLGTEMQNENGNPTEYAKFLNVAGKGLSVDDYLRMRKMEVDTDSLLELIDSGLNVHSAYALALDINEIEPTDGKTSISDLQKWRASVDFSDDVDDQLAALSMVMSETQLEKVEMANSYGISPRTYVDLRESMVKNDADGNGSFTNEETQNAIDAMYDLRLSTEQKAVLWQLATGRTSAKNNPYSADIGQRIVDARATQTASKDGNANTGSNSTGTMLTFEEEFARMMNGG